METDVTEWKWVRIPRVLHGRLDAAAAAVAQERARAEHARTEVRYYEVFEMALDALERERNRGVDLDHGGAGRVPGDAGSGNVDRLGGTGGL